MERCWLVPSIRVMALVLITGVSVSALVAYLQRRSNEHHIHQVVAMDATKVADAIERRVELYQYGLRGARGAILTATEAGISRRASRTYSLSRNIDLEFPGARGFGFIRRVPISEQKRFLLHARADDAPDFEIHQLDPNDGDRYVIQYIEPVERNKTALGLDIASEKNRRAAALTAMRTGKPALTAPITLVQAQEHPRQSFLFLMPIYRGVVTPASESEREADLLGWSYAPLLVKDVLDGLHLNNAMNHITLWDVTDPSSQQQFYQSEYDGLPLAYTNRSEREIFGRRWAISFSVHPAYVSALHLVSSKAIFAIGCVISLLLTVLSGILAINRQQKREADERVLALNISLEQQVVQRTEELKRSNRLLTRVFESASEVSIIATDSEGVIMVFNTGAEQMLGYKSSEVVGKVTPALLHDSGEVAARGRELSDEYGVPIEGFRVFVHKPETEGAETREWTYIRKDLSRVAVSLTVTVIRDEAGGVTGYLGIANDLTELKQQRSELIAARDQLLLAADVAELGVWSWVLADNSLVWNDRMYELYEQPKSLRESGLMYEHWRSSVHVDDVERVEAELIAAVEGRGIYDPVFRVLRSDGRIIYIQAGAQVERDIDGKPVRVTGINRDITVQLELESSLRRAKDQADAASAAKSSFLANMSHEIRTPMNAVLGMLQLVQKTPLDSHQRDYIDKARSAAKSLLSLLNDLLDYSKIEAGKLDLDLHPFEFDALMRDLAIVLSGSQIKEKVEVIFDISSSLPTIVIGDGLRLKQVLINLAGNALKFTEQGYVEVCVTELSRCDDCIDVRIAITDTGIGIDPIQQTRIFEAFTQAEASTTRRYGGTGLGLVISQRLVALMGGRLQLESKLGQGSRFWFDISLRIAPHAVSMKSMYPAFNKPIRVLIVDDNPVASAVLMSMMNALGWSVQSVCTGHDAVLAVSAATKDGGIYDLIFMNWQLPDMESTDAAQLMRDDAAGSARSPVIVMVNACGREVLSDKQNAANTPFAEFLSKPITPLQLIASSQRVLCGTQIHRKSIVATTHQQRLLGVRVLVVEDNILNRQIAAAMLTSEGAQVCLAEGGLDGVAQVLSGEQIFDVVIMDIQMPDIDGLEATRRIRADARFRDLPILAMTANVSQADREQSFSAGMNAHIGKPFDLEELVATLLMQTSKMTVGD